MTTYYDPHAAGRAIANKFIKALRRKKIGREQFEFNNRAEMHDLKKQLAKSFKPIAQQILKNRQAAEPGPVAAP